jgi:hypothetical protein
MAVIDGDTSTGLTRRDFAKRSGIAFAAVASAGSGLAALAPRAAAAVPGFTAARQQTYASLVEAVGRVPTSGVVASEASRATATFAGYYDRFSDSGRARLDALLDYIAAGPGGTGFCGLSAAGRLSFLRGWSGDRGDASAEERARLVVEAVSVAAVPFGPDPLTSQQPLVVSL